MSDDGLDELRHDLAVERGLDEAAVQFISGSTVDEIEAQADKLATLIGTHDVANATPTTSNDAEDDDLAVADATSDTRERGQSFDRDQRLRAEPSLTRLFADVSSAKVARKQALVDALVGRSEQQRDERGRFTASFDGGARPDNTPPEPETHDEWLGRVLASRAVDRGAHF